jgi:hypothetical protein
MGITLRVRMDVNVGGSVLIRPVLNLVELVLLELLLLAVDAAGPSRSRLRLHRARMNLRVRLGGQ